MNGRYTYTLTTGLVHVQVPQLCRRLHLNRGLEIAFIFGILKSGSNNMLIIRPYQLKYVAWARADRSKFGKHDFKMLIMSSTVRVQT